ncbi:MAG: solute carrier family 23 protein [Candidatus Ozemobacteraceae bacterium]
MEDECNALKPAGIRYGVNDKPPLWQAALLVVQYVLIAYGSLVIPALVARESRSSFEDARLFIASSLLTMGICTILQSSRRFGAGFLCPAVCGAEFAPASIAAVQQGGYALLSGMLMVCGIFQGVISPLIARLRPYFPVEVTGVVVFMTGLSLIKYALPGFLGIVDGRLFANSSEMIVAFLSLAIMIIPCVWGNGLIRQNAGLLGLAGGIVISLIAGCFPKIDEAMTAQPFIMVPRPGWAGWSWSFDMVIPFLIAGMCSVLGTLGNITACQKTNTIDWRRPDMKTLSKGVLTEAFGNFSGGVIGGAGLGSSAVSVGMSIATGVTSRYIGYGVGGCCILLSFFPGVSTLYALLPRPVLAASLILGVSFMLMTGIQVIASRMLDVRKTLVVGISIIAGLCVDIVPEIKETVCASLRPLFGSPLSVAAITALMLNMLFRIGVKKTEKIFLQYDSDSHVRIRNFFETHGAVWGMRKEVLSNAENALNHYIEGAAGKNSGAICFDISASFDEFNFELDIIHQGQPLDLSGNRPSMNELVDFPDSAVSQLEGFLVKQFADRASSGWQENTAYVNLGFEH